MGCIDGTDIVMTRCNYSKILSQQGKGVIAIQGLFVYNMLQTKSSNGRFSKSTTPCNIIPRRLRCIDNIPPQMLPP